ncbi:LysR substrate-binding domain-containing protein [Paracoccus sp. (in: a-proteobacteria)]|uniref:LysR substrate-binding domain-containing protein n=1 Tax=Paracoccus sp. TaxID=267 RepID=UPI00321FA5BF
MLRAKRKITPDMLREQGFIGYSGRGDVDGAAMTARVLGFPPTMSCTVSSPLMAMGLVAAGLGLAIVPSSVGGSDVEFRPISSDGVDLDVSLIWAKDHAGGVTGALLRLRETPA